jgi:hypothetical protein
MIAQQLDMFSSPEYAHLNTNVEKYKTSADNVRRGVFARLDALKKEVNPRIENLETQMSIMQAMLEKHFGKEESNIVDLQQVM